VKKVRNISKSLSQLWKKRLDFRHFTFHDDFIREAA
jgi:hypothetical protein